MKVTLNLRLLASGIALIVATALFAIPGYLTWDSGTYHLMVRALYKSGNFSIPNGYGELSSPLLAVGQTLVKNGSIVAQYPEYYTALSLPFYALFGYRGFMVLNAFAFVGICILIWRMASWFSIERNAPLAGLTVYALATYAIEFTQSSYPHLTSTFLICASIWLLWGAALGKHDLPQALPPFLRTIAGQCALAGLFFGVAIGVRLDSAFAGLALVLPLLKFRTLGWREMGACVLGILPAFLGLAWINAIKFGEFLPFSYGRDGGGYAASLNNYLPVASAVALIVAVLAWHRIRPFRLGRWGFAFALIAIAMALVLTSFGQHLIHGVFQILVDMRIRPEIPEFALNRSPGGAVVYWGNVKKSLLESCPYLILIVVPALRGLTSGTYGARWLLWLVPGSFVGFYGYLAWHGSVGWNMRYLNPTLPFLALLASHELLRVQEHIPVRRLLFWVGILTLWVLLVTALLSTRGSLARQEILILNGGLFLAILLLSCQGMESLISQGHSQAFRKALSAFFVVALVWSSALTFGVDYIIGANVRTYFLNAAREIQPHIPRGALIMTFQPDYVWGLLDTENQPIIANYMLGTPKDAVDLVERAFGSFPVYWLSPGYDEDTVSPAVFGELQSRNVRVESVLDASSDRRYRLFALNNGTIDHP